MHSRSSTRRATVPFTLFVVAVAGCGASESAPRSPNATAAHDAPAPAGYPGAMGGAAQAAPAMEAAKKADDASPKKPEETTWKRSQVAANATRLMVGEREELPLKTMQAKITVDGFRARVLIDYVYGNDRDRQLEGTFQLRLPEEASPYFFAFGESTYEAKPVAAGPTPQPLFFAVAETRKMGDGPLEIMNERQSSWIHPKEARMVPREKAAFAYGETVRRRVDPALMEWAGAGVFSARVFPLAPHKLHRVVVGYDLDLVRIGDDLEYRFDLPEKTPQAMVDIRVAKLAGVATTTTPAAPPAADERRQYFHFENPKDRTLTLRMKSPGAPAIVGSDAKTGDYFAAQVKPTLPAGAPSASMDSAVFLLDTSLSSNPDRFNVWLKMMRTVLDANRPQLKRFNVLFFGVDARWYKLGFAENTPAGVDALMTTAGGLALEGATDIGAALKEAAHPAWLEAKPGSKSYDVFLLSDGAATWGEGNLYALGRTFASGSAGSLYAYQTGLAGTDVAALTHLARESGGAVFSVTGEAEIVRAATAHRARPWQLASATVAGGSDVLLAGRPKAIFPGQTLLAVGRGAITAGAELVLTLERDGQKQTVKTKLGAPVPSKLAPRAYGQVATSQLEELEVATEGVSKAYATHFRVTGRTCSLLMLDSEQDYERFAIRPEEDAFVVKGTPAGDLFAATLKQTYDTLGDPKASFMALLAKLEKTPGVKLQVPAAYKMAVTQMPASAFAVDAAPLATKLTAKAQLAPNLLAMLAKHELDYDRISDDARARQGQAGPGDALKALSSLVEENPGDAVLARDVGFSAMDLGLRPQAYHLFRRVADMRPYEPQTYRAMAQALAAMGKTDLALAYYEIPLIGEWDPRFGDLRAIVELDYLRFLRGIAAGKAKTTASEYAKARLETLAKKIGMTEADLVVTITWNTDNTDVDLHVTEPGGEECFYSHRQTRTGGELTRDVTQGYGPEMYVLKRAPTGRYLVRAHYYASDRNRASARTKVYVTTYEDWGTPKERATEKVVTLETGKEMHDIALIDRR